MKIIKKVTNKNGKKIREWLTKRLNNKKVTNKNGQNDCTWLTKIGKIIETD